MGHPPWCQDIFYPEVHYHLIHPYLWLAQIHTASWPICLPLEFNIRVSIFLLADTISAKVATLVVVVNVWTWTVFFPFFQCLIGVIWEGFDQSSSGSVVKIKHMIAMEFLASSFISMKAFWVMSGAMQWVSLYFFNKVLESHILGREMFVLGACWFFACHTTRNFIVDL